MYKETLFIKRKLKGLAYKVFNLIENNGNSNFYKNGEEVFVDNMLYLFKCDAKKSGGLKQFLILV